MFRIHQFLDILQVIFAVHDNLKLLEKEVQFRILPLNDGTLILGKRIPMVSFLLILGLLSTLCTSRLTFMSTSRSTFLTFDLFSISSYSPASNNKIFCSTSVNSKSMLLACLHNCWRRQVSILGSDDMESTVSLSDAGSMMM